MDRSCFLRCREVAPDVLYNLLLILTRRLRAMTTQIQSLAALDVPGRVAHHMVSFAEEYGQALPGGEILIPLHLTKTELAEVVGA
jgi:CRP-like cAMP-binding protein